ncbi:MAG TPA: sensor histidine kinase [Amycolatopsis sp.]|nr:sensor histidine kinase [Amycolatopsis sp.]
MRRIRAASVATATALLVVGVVAAADWSEGGRQDPARALTLGPLMAFVADRRGFLQPFGVTELIVFLVVGVTTVASGAVVVRSRPQAVAGRLILLAGLLWLASGLRRSDDPMLFTTGVVLTYTPIPLLVQIGLGYPTGRLRLRWERWYLGGCWLLATGGVAAEWLFFDPRSAPADHASASRNLVLVWADPALANAVQSAVGLVAFLLAVVLVVALVSRWSSSRRPYSSEFAPVAVGGLIGVVVFVAGLLLAANTRLGGPWIGWLLNLRSPTMALLPLVVAVAASRNHFTRAAVRSAVIEIGAAPISEGFGDALRRALRDPSLVLWSYSDGCYHDEHGVPQDLADVPASRGVTALGRNGVPFGAVVHDGSLSAHPELLAAVRSGATLALEHERLRAELREQLSEVERSRERIVAAGDLQRHRIVRDLHDGAQQYLVASTIQLRRAQQAADDPRVRELIKCGADQIKVALAELRNLAAGVYPAVLADGGLAAALTSLAERTPLPVEIVDATTTRPPAHAELAAYFIAAEAVTNACKHARATHVEIRLGCDDAALRLEVRDDGCGGASVVDGGGLSGLSDRATTLGGTFTVDSPPGGGTAITVTLGCASQDPVAFR